MGVDCAGPGRVEDVVYSLEPEGVLCKDEGVVSDVGLGLGTLAVEAGGAGGLVGERKLDCAGVLVGDEDARGVRVDGGGHVGKAKGEKGAGVVRFDDGLAQFDGIADAGARDVGLAVQGVGGVHSTAQDVGEEKGAGRRGQEEGGRRKGAGRRGREEGGGRGRGEKGGGGTGEEGMRSDGEGGGGGVGMRGVRICC